MGSQMETIIIRQQQYERMKQMPLSVILGQKGNGITDDYLAGTAVPELRRAYNKRRVQENFRKCILILTIAAASLFILIMLVLFVFLAVYLQGGTSDGDAALQEVYENSPGQQAERAIESGDYSRAEKILHDALAGNPDGYFLYAVYAELYMAQARNDDAAQVLVDTIYDRFHVQNMVSAENQLYKKLREIPADSLKTSLQPYQSCLADCDAYIGKYRKMDSLIGQESYDSALRICNELKAEGAYDGYLCDYYYKCYSGMKAYDECAEYLIGLYGKQQGVTDLRYPSEKEISFYLEKIKEEVSSGMAAEIEALK